MTNSIPDADDEYNRDERIETLYQGWGAREMAERIVDLEDELGADVDGICTGMHADVAEAHAEVERLYGLVRDMEGTCIQLSEELDDARATNVELAKDARDGACWEAVAGRMRDEIGRLRAASDRHHAAWTSARRRAKTATGAWRYMLWRGDAQNKEMREQDEFARFLWGQMSERRQERDRYRLAWLSARLRAADEANFGMEALELKAAEIARLKARLDAVHAYAASRATVEYMNEASASWVLHLLDD
ncbi:hypothetical protein [Streptomyces sp. NPDC057557]|uniref:hypothetical protein n=1 Tax=Streptomyces sp. NPDC057557 TaxID=3346167 RepID=UPI0036AB0FD9